MTLVFNSYYPLLSPNFSIDRSIAQRRDFEQNLVTGFICLKLCPQKYVVKNDRVVIEFK